MKKSLHGLGKNTDTLRPIQMNSRQKLESKRKKERIIEQVGLLTEESLIE